MFMLMSHYRSPLNYSGDILIQSKNALDRIKTAKENLVFIERNGSEALSENEKAFIDTLSQYRDRFIEAMDDDLNTADAIAVIFELVRESNSIAADDSNSKVFAKETLAVLDELTNVLGLLYANKGAEDTLDAEVEALIKARELARRDKNWGEADKIRDELTKMGITLEDTKQGVKWKKN